MKLIRIAITMMVITFFSGSMLAQSQLFYRDAVIPVPAIENSGFGNIVAGVDFDDDGALEIYAVNDNSTDEGNELIPRIYGYEYNSETMMWDSVWSATLGIPLQNTWPALAYGDLDEDGKQEIIWGPVNNLGSANVPNPGRVIVFEATGNDNELGIPSGDNFLPNLNLPLPMKTI